MSWVATAIVGSAVIGGIASSAAAKQSRKGFDAATEEQRRQFDLTRSDFAPFLESGVNALGRLDDLSAGDFSSFQASPGFDFRRSEGIRDVGNVFAGRGGGGNAMKALVDFNQKLASNEFNNFFNQQLALAGGGQAATNSVAAFGANASSNISNNLIGAGNARASGIAGIANAANAGIGNFLFEKGRRPPARKSSGGGTVFIPPGGL